MADKPIQVATTTTQDFTPAQLFAWLSNVVRNDQHDSVFIWGPPGIGKSSIVEQVCKAQNIQMTDVRLSQLSPTDLRGLPVPDHNDRTSKWYAPEFLPRDPKSRGVLFLDEFNMAVPAIQGIAQQLILDRKVGSYELPPGWFIWSAGNRKEDKAVVFDMSAPIANRFLHVSAKPDLASFVEYGYASGKVEFDILAFLQFRPPLLHDIGLGRLSPAWPSPRSWVMASQMHRRNEGIAPAVGPSVESEFKAFLAHKSSLPDIDAIVEGRGKDIPFPDQISVRYALLSSLIGKAIAIDTDPNDPKVEQNSKMLMPKILNAAQWMFEKSAEAKRLEFSMLFIGNLEAAVGAQPGRKGMMAARLSNDPRTKTFFRGDPKEGIPSIQQLLARASQYQLEEDARERAKKELVPRRLRVLEFLLTSIDFVEDGLGQLEKKRDLPSAIVGLVSQGLLVGLGLGLGLFDRLVLVDRDLQKVQSRILFFLPRLGFFVSIFGKLLEFHGGFVELSDASSGIGSGPLEGKFLLGLGCSSLGFDGLLLSLGPDFSTLGEDLHLLAPGLGDFFSEGLGVHRLSPGQGNRVIMARAVSPAAAAPLVCEKEEPLVGV